MGLSSLQVECEPSYEDLKFRLLCRINWPLYQLALPGTDKGVSRGELSTRVLGGSGPISRAGSCRNEVRLGEDEVPDDPQVLRTRYSVKIFV